MRALVWQGPSRMDLEELPDPEAGPDEVVVDVMSAGICGSDVHAFDGSTGRREPGNIMGHEVAGVVAALGAGVTDVHEGQSVVLNPVVSCRRCDVCLSGWSNACAKCRLVGVSRDLPGGFADKLVVPADNVVPLDRADFDVGALIEPLAVGLHACRQAGVRPGDTVAIVGSGMIGLACAWAALRDGADRVVISDVEQERLALAAALGAEPVDVTQVSLQEVVAEIAGGTVDCAIDAVGVSATVAAALTVLRRGAVLCLVGMGVPVMEIPAYEVSVAQRVLVGSYCYSEQHFEEAVAAVAEDDFDAASFVDARVGLEDVAGHLGLLARGERSSVRTLVDLAG